MRTNGKWVYGVTTVPERRTTLLPGTLASLAAAGFDRPRLFVDGCTEADRGAYRTWLGSDYPVTFHDDRIKAFGTWYLAALELIIRNPDVDRYALFQDDMVAYRNLRQYLDRVLWPDKGYLNLYTWPDNEFGAQGKVGWHGAARVGAGAVALAFDRQALLTLLASPAFTTWICHPHRSHRKIDGTVAKALLGAGYTEYVHYPSLTQHTGTGHRASAIGNLPHPQSRSFLGEAYDALRFIEQGA